MKRLNKTVSKCEIQIPLLEIAPSKKHASLQAIAFELGTKHANIVKEYISNKKTRNIKALIFYTKAFRIAERLAR